MSSAHTYAQTHAERFRQQLIDLCRIPSVSTLPQHAEDVRRAAAWLIEDLRRIGMTRAEIFQRDHYLPLVYGEWMGAGESAPTVLIYCHYDVQPAFRSDGWDTEPFEPVERDGKLYARGAVDSKIHVVAQLKAIESMLATGGAPVNLKVLFEGEEESGSDHIMRFVAENRDLLACDVVALSDGSMFDPRQPTLVYGLRGVITMELIITAALRDLHSGAWGGSVHNPIQALAEIIAQLHDSNGTITVPGFYDAVRPYTDDERAALAGAREWAEPEWEQFVGAPQAWGEAEYAIHERVSVRPTLEINGIAGGYAGTGFKTVLPQQAIAKISCRLVPDQDPQQIYACVRDFIMQITPPTVNSELRMLDEGAPAILVERDNPAMRALYTAYERGWGCPPIYFREGGSIPVAAAFQRALNVPMVIMSFGHKAGGAHSTNEHIYLEMFHKGIATAIHFCQVFAHLNKVT